MKQIYCKLFGHDFSEWRHGREPEKKDLFTVTVCSFPHLRIWRRCERCGLIEWDVVSLYGQNLTGPRYIDFYPTIRDPK